ANQQEVRHCGNFLYRAQASDHLNKEELQYALRDAGQKLVLVNFSSHKCGQCTIVAPEYEKLCTEYPDILLYKVLDDAPKLCQHCEITSTPTFVFYKDRLKIKQFSGADIVQLRETIRKLY
uniref:Thioredoxin n=1 Tax=Xenopus tropicalis TaxID=8364 RepID=A0A803JG77_XENTR